MNRKIEILYNKGYKYIRVDDKLLTAKFGIDSEEKRLMLKISKNVNHVIFIFGIGIGRYVKDILERTKKNDQIIIYEPSEIIFNEFKNSKYYIEDESINYICGNIEEFEQKLNILRINLRHLTLAVYGNYLGEFKKIYSNALKVLKKKAQMAFVDEVTIQFFSRKFTENLILNIINGKFNDKINDMRDYFKNVPALIVSAGPSLDKNYKFIKDFNGIIFSGGRTLNILEKDNIDNVIFVSVDPGENAYFLVKEKNKKENRYPFFTFLESNNNIIKNYSGPKIIMQSSNTKLAEYNVINSKITQIDSGGSVANTSVSIAEYLGCDPIVFIGQDLAFTDNKHHSDSTISAFDNEINNRNSLEVDGYYGGKVFTSTSFLTFLSWFNYRIKKSNRVFINCTEGGAKIEGTTQLPFTEYLLNQNKKIDVKYNQFVDELEGKSLELNNDKLEDLLFDIKKIKKILKKNLLLSLDLKNKTISISKKNRALDKLNGYDDKIKEFTKVGSILNFIIANIMINFKNRKIGKNESIEDNNYKFYEEIYEELKIIEKIIGEANEK